VGAAGIDLRPLPYEEMSYFRKIKDLAANRAALPEFSTATRLLVLTSPAERTPTWESRTHDPIPAFAAVAAMQVGSPASVVPLAYPRAALGLIDATAACRRSRDGVLDPNRVWIDGCASRARAKRGVVRSRMSA
jgi:hypothetical protein